MATITTTQLQTDTAALSLTAKPDTPIEKPKVRRAIDEEGGTTTASV